MSTRTSLRRIRLGLLILGVVVVVGVIGYRILGRDWLDSLYMVVITVASVGYGEHSDLPPGEKVFTIAVIVFGLTAAAYTFGGFLQVVTEGELRRILGLRKMTRTIEQLKDHIIICGMGRTGQILVEELERRKTTFVVVDDDPQPIKDAQKLGHLALIGDATEEETLIGAGVLRAKTLVATLPSDAANVFITLTSRNLNPRLQIIARGTYRSTQKKLIQAGADRVILPAAIGAERIAAMITHPSTVELMELVAGRSVMDVELDELKIPSASPLVGKSLVEIEPRRKHGLLIVAVKHAEGGILFNPDPDVQCAGGDTIIIMGRVEDIERFRREFGL